MRTLGKLMFAALAATALLAFAVNAASANHLSTNERGMRVTWTSLEFISNVGVTVRCPATLEGEFSSATFSKVASATIGRVSVGTINSAACTGGHATVLSETLPWPISFEAFTGTLPNIVGFKFLLILPQIRIEGNGLVCIGRPRRIFLRTIGIDLGGLFRPETLTPESETFPCGITEGRLAGTGTMTRRGSTERILVALI